LLEAQLLEQQGPSSGNRRLRELQLAHIALGEVHRVRRILVIGKPVQDEDPLLTDARQPVRERWQALGRKLIGNEATRLIQQANPPQLGDGVHQAGATQATRLAVANHAQGHGRRTLGR